MSICKLMTDEVLVEAVKNLERTLSNLDHARSPVAGALRRSYTDALVAARNEMERRRP